MIARQKSPVCPSPGVQTLTIVKVSSDSNFESCISKRLELTAFAAAAVSLMFRRISRSLKSNWTKPIKCSLFFGISIYHVDRSKDPPLYLVDKRQKSP